jgi:hypothetical protein
MGIESLVVIVGSGSEGGNWRKGSFWVVAGRFLLFNDSGSDYNSATGGKIVDVPEEADEAADLQGSLEELPKGGRILSALRKHPPHSLQDAGFRIRCLQMSSFDLVVEVVERVQPGLDLPLRVHAHHPRGDLVVAEEAEEAFEGGECFPVGVEELVDRKGAVVEEGADGLDFDVDGCVIAERVLFDEGQ